MISISLRFAILDALMGVCMWTANAANAQVRIEVGDNFQSVVNTHPAGTTFIIAAGVHRQQQVVPRAGDRFVGEYGAVMKGSKLLNTAGIQHGASGYYFTGQTQSPVLSPISIEDIWTEGEGGIAESADSVREVQYANELFMNGQRLRHVNSLAQMNAPGTWYFDNAADRIYMYDNPAGQTIETSTTRNAFSVSANNVTIENLYLQQYANTERWGVDGGGVIGASNASGLTVRHVESSYNHAAGITFNNNTVIENSRFAYNGQMGVRGGNQNPTFRRNEVVGNKAIGYNAGWEGGATKFVGAQGGVFEHNWVHDNEGYAFWFDINNVGNQIRSNLVENNLDNGRGIFFEISGNTSGPATEIYWNTIRNNAGAGIYISDSQHVDIYENAIWGSTVGIDVADVSRDPGVDDITIRDNDILVTRSDGYQIRLRGGRIVLGDIDLIEANLYRGVNRFTWQSSILTWTQWKTMGFDTDSAAMFLLNNSDQPTLPAGAAPFAFTVYGPVPEPTTLGLMVGGAMLLIRRRVRREFKANPKRAT